MQFDFMDVEFTLMTEDFGKRRSVWARRAGYAIPMPTDTNRAIGQKCAGKQNKRPAALKVVSAMAAKEAAAPAPRVDPWHRLC